MTKIVIPTDKRCRSLKKKTFVLFLVFLSTVWFTQVNANNNKNTKSTDLFALITERIQNEFEGKVSLTATVARISLNIGKYNPDGSYSDIDYGATDRTNWPPLEHIERIYDMTYAYTMPGNLYYEDETILKKIEDAFVFWINRNPSSSNWWYNQIAEPQRVGRILLQLRKGKTQLTKEIEDLAIKRMKDKGGNPAAQTGPNKTDIALHYLYRACLTEDETLMNKALDEAYVPLKFVSPTSEGIQYDYSYFQHGKQLYIGGYGDELIKGTLMFANYTVGTDFALKGDKLAIFSEFVRRTYFKVIRGKYIHMNVLGRGVSRLNATSKSATYAQNMISIDPTHADEYATIVKRIKGEEPASFGITANNTSYYIGDYVTHIRPDYAFGVRSVSTRTNRNEYGNGEALQVYFLSDGSTHIRWVL